MEVKATSQLYGWTRDKGMLETSGIELQLLVIDLGDVCVIREEIDNTIENRTDQWRDALDLVCGIRGTGLTSRKFADIRAAIDALEGEKPPVPRLERVISGNGYSLICDNEDVNHTFILSCDRDALSELAGKPLPVWTPQRGEWNELIGPYRNYVPMQVWRYTLKKDISENVFDSVNSNDDGGG